MYPLQEQRARHKNPQFITFFIKKNNSWFLSRSYDAGSWHLVFEHLALAMLSQKRSQPHDQMQQVLDHLKIYGFLTIQSVKSRACFFGWRSWYILYHVLCFSIPWISSAPWSGSSVTGEDGVRKLGAIDTVELFDLYLLAFPFSLIHTPHHCPTPPFEKARLP